MRFTILFLVSTFFIVHGAVINSSESDNQVKQESDELAKTAYSHALDEKNKDKQYGNKDFNVVELKSGGKRLKNEFDRSDEDFKPGDFDDSNGDHKPKNKDYYDDLSTEKSSDDLKPDDDKRKPADRGEEDKNNDSDDKSDDQDKGEDKPNKNNDEKSNDKGNSDAKDDSDDSKTPRNKGSKNRRHRTEHGNDDDLPEYTTTQGFTTRGSSLPQTSTSNSQTTTRGSPVPQTSTSNSQTTLPPTTNPPATETSTTSTSTTTTLTPPTSTPDPHGRGFHFSWLNFLIGCIVMIVIGLIAWVIQKLVKIFLKPRQQRSYSPIAESRYNENVDE